MSLPSWYANVNKVIGQAYNWPDDINVVVTKMRSLGGMQTTDLMFYCGHRIEVEKQLTLKDRNGEGAYKYPAIILIQDFPENVWEANEAILNLAVVNYTEKTDTTTDRYEKVFKPVLYPLYELFLVALKQVGRFTWDGYQKRPQHTKVDRPFYGTKKDNGNEANFFRDPLDAIELVDLKLKRLKTC